VPAEGQLGLTSIKQLKFIVGNIFKIFPKSRVIFQGDFNEKCIVEVEHFVVSFNIKPVKPNKWGRTAEGVSWIKCSLTSPSTAPIPGI
jgi:hypothetical protein